MTDTSAIDYAVRRLSSALAALESAVEHKLAAERGEGGYAARLHALGSDRARLAAELDQAAGRARGLETTNREIAQKLDAAIAGIRAVLENGEG